MEKRARRIFSLILAMFMAISLFSACANKEDTGKDKETKSTANESASKTPEETKKPDEKVTLRLGTCWSSADPTYNVKEAVIAKFKELHPNVTIEDESIAAGPYHDKLKTEIASNTLPDIFVNWGGGEVRGAVESGKFMDLTELLEEDPDFKDSFVPGALNGVNVTYMDLPGQWGLPFGFLSTGFFYNKEIFEKADVTIPKTWSELIAAIEKLKAYGTIPWVVGGKDGWRIQHIHNAVFYKMNGVQMARDLAARKVKYTDPEVVETFKKLAELRDMGAFGPMPASVDFSMEQNLFQNGKAAMNFSLDVFIPTFTGDESAIKDKVGFFEFPYFEDKPENKGAMFAGGSACFSLNSELEGAKKEMAFELIKLFTGPEGQKIAYEMGALIPCVKVENVDESKIHPLQKAFAEAIVHSDQTGPDITEFDKIPSLLNDLRNICTGLLNNQLTPEQAAQEMDANIAKNSQ